MANTEDTMIKTPSTRWRLYNRPNGSHYAVSPYGRQVELDSAAAPAFFAVAAGLGLLPNELSRLCDLAPPTEPTVETLAMEGRR